MSHYGSRVALPYSYHDHDKVLGSQASDINEELSVTVAIEMLLPTAIMFTVNYWVHSSVTFLRNDQSQFRYRCSSLQQS
jgi:hypothetical protein